jgi:glucan 1,3-beta-glucosidase
MTQTEYQPAVNCARNARRTAVLILLAVVLGAVLAEAVWNGRPVALPDSGGVNLPRVACVSYAPFRRAGETPFDPDLRISPADIEADLRRLATLTGCVRTYGLDHGLDAVPDVARRVGLRVVLGAWVGRDAAANAAQLNRALELARDYRDVVQMLVVGNEVLLRRELSPQALAELLARARRESPVPVAYADVWEFWWRHAPALREHVDVVAIHILPYWEDQPVGIEQAVEHVYAIAAQMHQAFGTTPVWVAETGWPAAGRQRGAARPGRLEQARFVRALLARQQNEPLSFNLVEGFDQPWKRDLEGAMGGAWGLFDTHGELRVPLTGPVVPEPRWFWLPWVAALGGAVGWAFRGRQQHVRGCQPRWALALSGALISVFAMLQALALPEWSRDTWEWVIGLAKLSLSVLCGVMAAWRLAQVLGGDTLQARAGLVAESAWPLALSRRPVATPLVLAMVLFIAAVDALALVFDARYRPFPWPGLAAPAVLLTALAWLDDRLPASAREERLLAGVCAGCAVLVVGLEGMANTQALLYAALLLMLAMATLWPHRALAGGSSARAASSTAGAAQSVE